MLAKNNKGTFQKAARYIAPGKLANERGFGKKAWRPIAESTGNTQKPLAKDQEPMHTNNHRRNESEISTYTLIVHYGDEFWREENFSEDSSLLDIWNICKKLFDIYSVGLSITGRFGITLRNDEDLLALMRNYENGEIIRIHVEPDENEQPLRFKLPLDNPKLAPVPMLPIIDVVEIRGESKAYEKVTVCGDVRNGSLEASMVQYFITISKNFGSETNLQAISECVQNNKEFSIPKDSVGHFLVAKLTPMNDDGESGEPKYAITEKYVEDSLPPSKKKVRGKNKNKTIAALKPGEKLEIKFYNNRAVGPQQSRWSRHLGKIVRDKHICPIRMKTWTELTELNKQHMWDAVKEVFYNDNIELYRDHTLEHMRTLWTAWMSKLNTDYVTPCKTKTEALKNVPSDMDTNDWEWLVSNKFLTEKFQKTSDMNANNRKKGSMPHRTGSKPHRQIIYEMGGEQNNPPDVAKIFQVTRQKNGMFAEPESQQKYDEIVKTVQSNASLSHIEVVEKCFGPQRHSHVFGYGGGMKRKHFNDTKDTYIKELEAKLHDKEEENINLKRRMDKFENRLTQIENGTQQMSNGPAMPHHDLE